MPLQLVRQTPADAISGVRIRTLAYAGPTNRLIYPYPLSEDSIRQLALSRQTEMRPNTWFWKIVDTDLPHSADDPSDNGGRTIAVAIWSAHGVSLDVYGRRVTQEANRGDKDAQQETSDSTKEVAKATPFIPPGVRHDVLDAFLTPFRVARSEIMGGRSYLMLNSLAVHPDHQRRGAGRMLLKWGVEVADTAGLEMYLESSRSGKGLYEKEGFVVNREVHFHRGLWGGQGVDWHGCMVRRVREVEEEEDESWLDGWN